MHAGGDESLEPTDGIRRLTHLGDRPVRDREVFRGGLDGGVDDLVRMVAGRFRLWRVEVPQTGGLGDESEDALLRLAADHLGVQESRAGIDVEEPDPVLRVGQGRHGRGGAHLLLDLVVPGLDALDRGARGGPDERPGTGDGPDLVEPVAHHAEGVTGFDVQERVPVTATLEVGGGGDPAARAAVDRHTEGENHPDHGRQENESGRATCS